MTDATLNGSSLATAVPAASILRVRRTLLGFRRDQFVDVPGRRSSWVFAEEPGDRSIVLEVDLGATSFATRRSAVTALADWADTLAGRVPLIIDDETDRYYEVVLDNAPDVDEWLITGYAELSYRSGPYALAVSTSSQSITATGGAATGSFTAADGITAYPVVVVTPIGGTLTGFTLDLNGSALTWAGLRGAGLPVTVSSISYTVTDGANTDVNLTGAYVAGDVNMSSVSGEFPVIVPGTNTYTFTTTGTATSVRFAIQWRRNYR